MAEQISEVANELISSLNKATKKGSEFTKEILENEMGLIRYISAKENTSVNAETGIISTKLPPINVCLVAPTGAGKTTILSTIVNYLEFNLHKADGFSIESASQTDATILNEFNLDLSKKLATGQIRLNMNIQQGSSETKTYKFYIKFKYTVSNKPVELIQPFVIMDIPGRYLNPDELGRIDSEFEAHLNNSQIVWIPVDAPVLMTPDPENREQNSYSVALSRTDAMHKLLHTWAQFVNKSFQEKSLPSNVCFSPVKCETYLKPDKYRELKNKVVSRYQETISSIKSESPTTKIFYVPVETVGCVELVDWKWSGNPESLKTDYGVIGDGNRKISGADGLLYSLFDFTISQLKQRYESDKSALENLINNAGLFDWLFGKKRSWKDIEFDLLRVYENLKPIIEEMERLKNSARNSFETLN
ncbi:MAG: hypothetical protein K6B43_08120 [Treponema sp.]|nr:hypothetical protein [Treponema sp.]